MRAFLLKPQGTTGLGRIGDYLHDLLDAGDVGRRWRERWDAGDVRVMLDVRAPRLQRLPWELLFNAPNWLCADPTRPLMRVTSRFPGAAEIGPVRWPLRVLVVEGSKPDDTVVDAETEIRRLEHAFRRHVAGSSTSSFLHQPDARDDRAPPTRSCGRTSSTSSATATWQAGGPSCCCTTRDTGRTCRGRRT